jgi:hypothetical protein
MQTSTQSNPTAGPWSTGKVLASLGLLVIALLWLSHAVDSATAPPASVGQGDGQIAPAPGLGPIGLDPDYGGGAPPSADDPSLTPGGSGGVPDTGGYDLSGQPYPGDPSIAPIGTGGGEIPDY